MKFSNILTIGNNKRIIFVKNKRDIRLPNLILEKSIN